MENLDCCVAGQEGRRGEGGVESARFLHAIIGSKQNSPARAPCRRASEQYREGIHQWTGGDAWMDVTI